MIANKVYTICQKENAQTSLVKALDKQIKKINKSIENLMVALENGENVDLINQRITDKRVELEQTKKQYDLESKKVITTYSSVHDVYEADKNYDLTVEKSLQESKENIKDVLEEKYAIATETINNKYQLIVEFAI